MSVSSGVVPADIEVGDLVGGASPPHEAADVLQRGFGVRFNLADGESGELVYASPDQPARGWQMQAELCRQVARRGRPEFIEEESPFVVLALPLPGADDRVDVAVGTFVTRPVLPGDDVAEAARLLGMEPAEAVAWASQQTPWPHETLERVARLVTEQRAGAGRMEQLEKETQNLSLQLAATYEEISLLYRITQNLKISESDEDLGRVALEWLQEVVPAKGLAVQLLPVAEEDESLTHHGRTESVLLCWGQCPVTDEQFTGLTEHLDLRSATQPTVVNLPATQDPSWPSPQVRQMIAVPLSEGENLFGWMAAFNHVDDAEFGTVEASLLSSVAAILGIHSGNIELYRQQSELFAGIVRALSSAIDAKDPYTCGHSDRVARVAVRLAQEIGCDHRTINTIYLSGLLHDIGKIGIDDGVLRKPGKLTDEEYEHIKTHVRIGNRILLDLKKLDDVLPVVLHHHESWDGGGYPGGLAAEEIPLPARIVAVADAFDAMGSDRPYRQGMPDEKIDEIFRRGAGRQWDPQVVEAFFGVREELRQVTRTDEDRAHLDLQPQT